MFNITVMFPRMEAISVVEASDTDTPEHIVESVKKQHPILADIPGVHENKRILLYSGESMPLPASSLSDNGIKAGGKFLVVEDSSVAEIDLFMEMFPEQMRSINPELEKADTHMGTVTISPYLTVRQLKLQIYNRYAIKTAIQQLYVCGVLLDNYDAYVTKKDANELKAGRIRVRVCHAGDLPPKSSHPSPKREKKTEEQEEEEEEEGKPPVPE